MKRNITPGRDGRPSIVGDDEPDYTREGGSELFVGQRMREWGTVDEMQGSSIEEKCNNLPMTKKQNG